MLGRLFGVAIGALALGTVLSGCSYFVSDVKGFDSAEAFTSAVTQGGITCGGQAPVFTEKADPTDPTFTYFEAPCGDLTLTYYPEGHPIGRDRCTRPDSTEVIVAGLNWTVVGAQGDQAQEMADAAKGEVMTVGQFDRQVCKNYRP